jgi:thiamine-phosphate pyrophosphorylase
MTMRLFLVAPDHISEALLLDCAGAAARAADCAAIVVNGEIGPGAVISLQAMGLAVLLRDAEPRRVHHLRADGMHLSSLAALQEARHALKDESLGFLAGTSRHAAMEAADAGADYVAFNQARQTGGEPIIAWWQDVTALPAVAFDPVDPAQLSTLLPQKPDFLRPSDAMWTDAAAAVRELARLVAATA